MTDQVETPLPETPVVETPVPQAKPTRYRDDTLKAVIQERKMAKAGVVEKPQRWERPGRFYAPSSVALPTPTGYMPASPTYWQNPSAIVAHYNEILANQDTAYPWKEYVENAFAYLSNLPQNSGKNNTEWTWFGENDPIMLGMAQYAAPPAELQRLAPTKSQSDLLYSSIYPLAPKLSPVTQAAVANVNLPEWQQWYETLTGSPFAMAAMQATPTFIATTLIGTALTGGNPLGGMLAGGLSIVAMGLMQEGTQSGFFTNVFGQEVGGGINKAWEKFMRWQNWPAEVAEQAIGTAQLIAREGAPQTAEEWKAAWKASALTYEAGGVNRMANIFPAIEILTDRWNWTDPKTVPQLANYGEVLMLGKPGPVDVGDKYVGLAAINFARNEIMQGRKPPSQIVAEMRQIYGVSGEFTDLMMQTMLDPSWTLVPAAVKGGIAGIGKLTHNKYIPMALRHTQLTEGAIGFARQYQNVLKGAPVSDLTKFQLRIAGIDPVTKLPKYQSVPIRLLKFGGTIAENPINPLAWVNAFADLAPASKYHLSTDIATRTILETFDRVRRDTSDPLPFEDRLEVEMNRALRGTKMGDQVRYAAMYDSSDWYAVRQWALDMELDIKKIISDYRIGQPNRDLLIRTGELMQKKPEEVIAMARDFGEDRAVMFAKLRDAIAAKGNGEDILLDPRFTQDSVAEMFKWVDKNPHNPEMLNIELFDAMMGKMSTWAQQTFGIKKMGRFNRVMADFKAIGSLFLLGFSPRYFIKNITDGQIGMLTQGVWGLRRMKTVLDAIETKRLYTARGVTGYGMGESEATARAAGGTGYAEVQRVLQKYENELHKMEQGGDAKGFEATAHKLVSELNQLGPFTRLSAKVESLQRATLTMNGYNRAYPKFADSLFVKLDAIPELRTVLDRSGIPADRFTREVRAAFLQGDSDMLHRALYGGAPELWNSPEAHVDVTAKRMGLPLDKMVEVLHVEGVFDHIKERLDMGQSVDQAFDGVRLDIEKAFGRNQADRLLEMAHDLQARVQTEGFHAALPVMREMVEAKFERHGRNDMEMQDAIERANAAETPVERGKIYRAARNRNRAGWNNFNKQDIANMAGILRALGFDSADPASRTREVSRVVDAWTRLHEDWNEFFDKSDRLYDEAFKAGYERGHPRYAEIRAELAADYLMFAERELSFIGTLRDSMVDLFSRQFDDIDVEPIRSFWKEVSDTTQLRQHVVTHWRSALDGMGVRELRDGMVGAWRALPDGDLKVRMEAANRKLLEIIREAADEGVPLSSRWSKFWSESYMPVVGEGIIRMGDAETFMTRAVEEGRQAVEPQAAEAMPAIDAQWWLDTVKADAVAQQILKQHQFDTGEIKQLPLVSRYLLEETPVSEEAAAKFAAGEAVRPEEAAQMPPIPPDEVVPVTVLPEPQKGVFLPKGASVVRTPRALAYRNQLITGMAGFDGDFAAWVTQRFDQMLPQETALGRVQLLGEDMAGNWVYIDENGRLARMPIEAQSEPPALGYLAPHTIEDLGGGRSPYPEILQDGAHNFLFPIMEELKRTMKGPRPLGGEMAKLTPADARLLREYETSLQDAMSSARLHSMRVAESNGDMAILNYQKRTRADAFISAFLPYQFWYSRSALKWALYAIDRPGMMAFYSRLLKFMSQHEDETTQYPTRLKGNLGMSLPWLPEWAGGAGYFDPLNEFFPMHNFVRPYQMLQGMEDRTSRDAKYLILQQYNQGEISFQQAQQAIESGTGSIWDNSLTKAQMDSKTGNMLDYISLFQSPILPLTALWNKTVDREPMNQLPMSRFLQGLSGVTGMKWPALLDLQARWNKSRGVSEFGDWGNYYIDRQLSNMAAENPANLDAVTLAMIEHQGPLYEEAVKRVQYEQGLTSGLGGVAGIAGALKGEVGAGELADALLFGWLPFKLLPEGELKHRGLKDEWDAAVMQQREGDPDAVEEFLDKYPEYRARLALFDEPQDRLRYFLVDKIWDKYWQLSTPDKNAAKEQLGQQFATSFVNKGTRDYSAISLKTMAGWAQFFSTRLPEGTEAQSLGTFQPEPANVSAVYTMFETDRAAILSKEAYYDLKDQYYALPAAQHKAFLREHPELAQYWDVEDYYLKAFPFMKEYLDSQEYKDRVTNAWAVVQELGGAADYLRQYYTGKEMPAGVRSYLYHYWNTHGRPKGDFTKWLYGMSYLFVP